MKKNESKRNPIAITNQPETIEKVQNGFFGLTNFEVVKRRNQYGSNSLPTEKGPNGWSILFSQFKSPLVYIILIAAIVSLIVGEFGDFGIIMAVVIINAILGFTQEYRAQLTYTALKGLVKPTTTVLRNGQRKEIEVSELVPGDLVILTSGEHIPADGILLQSSKLVIDESIMTGESEAVVKSTSEDQNSLFMGTTIITGHGIMEVTKIGSSSELGLIATSINTDQDNETPLQVRLKVFSNTLTKIVIGFTIVIMIAGLLLGEQFLDMARISIILAIAAVPEGLLIAVTVILVLGMRKILKRNGLVKKLQAVETLGSVTVICTDKTGTLTEGRMRVTKTDINDIEKAIQIMILCNNQEGPVDIALREYGASLTKKDPLLLIDESPRINEELFSSETKFMITSNTVSGSTFHFLKGAPEIVLNMCQLSKNEKQSLQKKIEVWASEGLRLIGFAYRESGLLEDHTGYRWAGLIALEDPIREGVREAIKLTNRAGIQVKMITGDYARTAEKIGKLIGLYKDDDLLLEGDSLNKLSDEQLQEKVRKTTIFSRIRPQDKLRIVQALQVNGEVIAMIGDGVNDAPALKRANIGVVVNSATDVAKEIADVILLDNNFSTIVACIEEGRVIFENIRKVVAYTLSNSFAEVLTIFGAMVLHLPAPLVVAQILWIHLICDGPSDIVLGFEPKEPGIMQKKPISLKEPILTGLGLMLIGIISIFSSMVALLIFSHYYSLHSPEIGRSMVFASFAVNSMIYIFAYRSMYYPLIRMPSLKMNKPLIWAVGGGLLVAMIAFIIMPLRNLLGIVPLDLYQWFIIATIALTLLFTVEFGKFISRRLEIRKN